MGGLAGGGTSQNASQKAYIPQAQATADQGYQGLTHTLFDQSQAGLANLGGITPAGSVYPTVQQTTQNVLQNPYQNQYVQGGQNAYDFFQQGQMPNIYQGSQQLAGLGNLAAGAGANPAYAQAAQIGAGQSGGFQGAVQQLLGDIFNPNYQNAIGQGNAQAGRLFGDAFSPQYDATVAAGNTAAGKQFGAGDAIRTQAFDPQNALYDRTYNRLSDQTGAGIANSGLANTPYGQSVRGNTLGNFNIDWQNQQLQRMMQGGQAAAGLDTSGISQMLQPTQARTQAGISDIGAGLSAMLNPATAASSAAASDLGAAGGGLTSALNAFLQPANAQNNALGVATGAASQGFGGANTLLGQGSAGMNQYAGLPYQNLNTTQGNNFGALQNQVALGNQAYALPQQVLNDLQSYLGLGQSASGLANNIGTTNFNQLAQGASGLGQLASGLGSGGSGGGLGSLLGTVGGSADYGGGGAALGIADQIGGAAASSPSGILGALSSALPFSISA
jgi:hypothetical protein